MNNFEIENFCFFKIFFNWIFNENFSMKIFDFIISVGRFQNALTFFVMNRFGRDFFQSCVDFFSGHDGTGFHMNFCAACPPSRPGAPEKKQLFLLENLHIAAPT